MAGVAALARYAAAAKADDVKVLHAEAEAIEVFDLSPKRQKHKC